MSKWLILTFAMVESNVIVLTPGVMLCIIALVYRVFQKWCWTTEFRAVFNME